MERFIGNNYAAFKTTVEEDLKCMGTCQKCPFPEKDKYPDVQAQVDACWSAVEAIYHQDMQVA